MPLLIALATGAFVGLLTWVFAHHGHPLVVAPRVEPATIREEVRKHGLLSRLVRSRLDRTSATGLALTIELLLVIAGAIVFAVILFEVRRNKGFAHFDLAAAKYGASHKTALSTAGLRILTQLGGSLVVIPLSVIVLVIVWRRTRRWRSALGFLVATVGGQFLLANAIKAVVHRARPNLDQLTGFASSSFPSGHAVTAAASFAAFALLLSRGRSHRISSLMAATAAGLAAAVGCTRIFLGVHWMTDVVAGLFLGWTWFSLGSIAFGGRLLRFGAPVEQAKAVAGARPEEGQRSTEGRSEQRSHTIS